MQESDPKKIINKISFNLNAQIYLVWKHVPLLYDIQNTKKAHGESGSVKQITFMQSLPIIDSNNSF